MVKKNRKPTCVNLVWEHLVAKQDFESIGGLCEATGLDRDAVMKALWHLRLHKAVDSVESEGHLWWFACPEYDDRTKKVAERAVEEKPRARRRKAGP